MNNFEKNCEGELASNILTLLENNQSILVSGMPLRVFHPSDPSQDRFFEQCTELQEELLQPPFRLFTQYFGSSELGLPECFLPDDNKLSYPVLQGFTIDGSEVVLGIRKSLCFSAKGPDV